MKVLIVGGGTVSHVRTHCALASVAYGGTARKLGALFTSKHVNVELLLTAMASEGKGPETSEELLSQIIICLDQNGKEKVSHCIMNAAICDFDGQIGETISGKLAKRLSSREVNLPLRLTPAKKLLKTLTEEFQDVQFVGYKTMSGNTDDEMLSAVNRQIEETGVSYVVGNDIATNINYIFKNEGSRAVLLFKGDRADTNQNLVNIITSHS